MALAALDAIYNRGAADYVLSMDPLIEAAAMALAHLYGDEDNWQKYVLAATAVVERIEPMIQRKPQSDRQS